MKFLLHCLLLTFFLTPLWGAQVGSKTYCRQAVASGSSSGKKSLDFSKEEISTASLPEAFWVQKSPLVLQVMQTGSYAAKQLRAYPGNSARMLSFQAPSPTVVKLKPNYEVCFYGLRHKEKLLFPVHYFL